MEAITVFTVVLALLIFYGVTYFWEKRARELEESIGRLVSELSKKPMELEAGKTYVIKIENPISKKQLESLREQYVKVADKIGCKFVFLTEGLLLLTDGSPGEK